MLALAGALGVGSLLGSAQVVWDGPDTTFTKPDGADWTQAGFQDRITANVWITRANSRGIFNIAQEPSYDGFDTVGPSPVDTEWVVTGLNGAPGSGVSAANYALLASYFDTWATTAGGIPPGLVGRAGVVHLITDDIYIDITFTSWNSPDIGPGTGFSYTRSTAPVPEPHEYALMAGVGLLGFAAWRRRRAG